MQLLQGSGSNTAKRDGVDEYDGRQVVGDKLVVARDDLAEIPEMAEQVLD